LSVIFFIKENYSLSLCFIILFGLALRIYIAQDPFLHNWDEKFHALVAKNLMANPFKPMLYSNPILPYDYTNWTANHIWLHKQPMPLWLISMSLKIFGINEFSVRIPSIILSTICIWLTYFIGSKLFNNKVATIAAFLFSINGLVIELTGGRVATDHIDITFLFFIELAIVFTIIFIHKKRLFYCFLIGLCIGAAILTKWLPALIVLPIWFLLVYDSKKFSLKAILFYFVYIILTTALLSIPWQIYVYSYFPKEALWESTFNTRHFTEVLENQGGTYFYFINKIRINYGELIYLPLIWFLIDLIKNPFRFKRFALLVWFMVPLVFFSIAKTKMQAYLLFVCPAFFIITADFCQYLMLIDKSKAKWLYRVIVIVLLITPIRYCFERLKPFEKNIANTEITASILQLKAMQFNDKDVLLNCDYPIEMMFYSDIVSYKGLPDIKAIESLINKGYRVHINHHQKVSNEIEKINGVILIDLGF
jgi:4-amino-4-deoxy-L-arabinose transferase